VVVDERDETIAGRAIAVAPGHQELGDFSGLLDVFQMSSWRVYESAAAAGRRRWTSEPTFVA
jgi:hypothetical protein